MSEQARAFLIYSALLLGVGGGGGFAGGRMTAPATPFEVRFVHIPVPAISLPAEPVPAEPEDPVPQAPPLASIPMEPVRAPPAQLEEKPPLPQPRPKLEAKPKPKPQPKPRPIRKPIASECAQLKIGMLTIGKSGVYEKAKARNYTKAQVDWAVSVCGL